MGKRPIDWAVVADARRALDEIARRRPDLVGAPSPENRAAWEVALATLGEAVPATPVVIRFDAELLDRVDAHAERLRALVPGLAVTRSDAVRALLVAALDAAEAEAPKRKRHR